jgi:hypothetical protein
MFPTIIFRTFKTTWRWNKYKGIILSRLVPTEKAFQKILLLLPTAQKAGDVISTSTRNMNNKGIAAAQNFFTGAERPF